MSRLLNCPRCGTRPLRKYDNSLFIKAAMVQCLSCGLSTEWYSAFWLSDASDMADDEWNDYVKTYKKFSDNFLQP